MQQSNTRSPFLSFIFLLSFTATLSATSYTYTNGSGDELWSNPSNWNPNGIPGSTDEATINNAIINNAITTTATSFLTQGG